MTGRMKRLADYTHQDSLSLKLRRKRFSILRDLLERIPKPARVLDIGGTAQYWEMLEVDLTMLSVTILNLHKPQRSHPLIEFVEGDARDLSCYRDNQFDVVHSNSVIEHVGALEDQNKMAAETRRVGRFYFVQTPNRYFPIEPHFLFPLFQFFPRPLQAFLLMNFRLGWMKRKCSSKHEAYAKIDRIRLIRLKEFRQMFPDGRIIKERFAGLTKSLLAVRDPSSINTGKLLDTMPVPF